jgi:hypothetical protein
MAATEPAHVPSAEAADVAPAEAADMAPAHMTAADMASPHVAAPAAMSVGERELRSGKNDGRKQSGGATKTGEHRGPP